MIVQRKLLDFFLRKLQPGKVCLLVGPRRVGKTVFLNQLLEKAGKTHLLVNGEDPFSTNELSSKNIHTIRQLVNGKDLLLIDEAQKIPGIGSTLKFIVDSIPSLNVVATGSSAFYLFEELGDPLTGRKYTFHLYPFSTEEFLQYNNRLEFKQKLHERLVFGTYPELIHLNTIADKQLYMKELVNDYLLRDIIAFEGIKKSTTIVSLLKLISYQTGSEVSLEELGQQLGISKNTVERYLDLLEKCFVLVKLKGYSKNLRKEVTRMSKWYFTDNGIRNTVISALSPFTARNDHGLLWENFMVSERIKFQAYHPEKFPLVNNYFWRTYDHQEIDWIEENNNKLSAWEFKSKPKKTKAPSAWREGYPGTRFTEITPDNHMEWLTL